MLLYALLHNNPNSSLVPKLAKGLLAGKKKGKWGSTQENCWALLALDKYFRIYEKDEPDYKVKKKKKKKIFFFNSL